MMTLFNVRLGSWIRNPDLDRVTRARWKPLLWFWLTELFGKATTEDRYVYITDGGHFYNSAIYELLKRRCKYILAIDASTDKLSMGNLATVARLARIDLGVQLDIDMDPLKPNPATGLSDRSFAVGKIKYPPVENDAKPTEGILVFISTARTPRLKPDVLEYATTHSDFPTVTTLDQFFDQIQFESYRQLGHTAAGTTFESLLPGSGTTTREQVEEIFEELWEQASTDQ